ncbi:MAG: CRISPR-associated endoribonuclease Cas6 [Bacteroides sp.]|nr:CRISPR-associated endoribonuclease Cas6 [Ruminococcus flavefaciens]MCM1555178.1 CRISPR-associated endoribonuclease Cas6 [Bacteroides sp.]
MRFVLKLQLDPEDKHRALPLNYQYELSAAIYRILALGDEKYATWLHENGFEADNKRFKLFTFSNLRVPRYEVDKELGRLHILSDEVYWQMGFLPDKSTKEFIKGVFNHQVFSVGDRVSRVEFAVRDIELFPEVSLKETEIFRTLSPVVVSLRNESGKQVYLSPEHPDYLNGILIGLKARYKAYYGEDYKGSEACGFRLLDRPRSALVKIKADTPQQTYVRGFRYKCELSLPEPLMRIAYECGLGEKGSIGFGMIERA